MPVSSSHSSHRVPLRTPYALAGWLIALAIIIWEASLARSALRDHAAIDALRFLVMLPLTLYWCFILSLFLPVRLKAALAAFASRLPGIGMGAWLYFLFAMFVMDYGFK